MARILIIIPFDNLFPPFNGGMLRRFHLLRELAREHDVHAIILQAEEELRQLKAGYKFPESPKIYGPIQTPPPQTFFDKMPRRIGRALHYRWLRRSWRGPASSILLETHHLIRQIIMTYDVDVAIFTDLSSMSAASLIERLSPKSIRILSTDNVDHHLQAQELQSANGNQIERKSLQKNYSHTRLYESHLARFVHAFFTCSDEDREVLELLNRGAAKGFTIPNGVDTPMRPFDDRPIKGECRAVLFCGSLDYPPNRDGLLWFHGSIWPLILGRRPDVRLVVIGRGAGKGDFGALRADSSVDFIGAVEDVVPYYNRTRVLVVPVRMGSGTRLKILEAMSLGNAVVSTSIGAQGIEAVDGEHLLLANEPTQFAEAVEHLLLETESFERIRRSARKLVEQKYDWQVIGQSMNKAIDSLIVNAHAAKGELTL